MGHRTPRDQIVTSFSEDQLKAFQLLRSGENVFLTGGAGTGKSYVIRQLLEELPNKSFPLLASTGSAAVLLGGRTFHSFFGLGIMEGGPSGTLERGLKNSKLLSRLKKIEGFIVDEISMIPGSALDVAESLARAARDSSMPWGGLRVIVVGDFAQLPPVQRFDVRGPRDWAFKSEAWKKSDFLWASLNANHRTDEKDFIQHLHTIRKGMLTSEVKDFLNEHLREHDDEDQGTRLFPRRDQSESYNLKKLAEIKDEEVEIPSIYFGSEKHQEMLMKSSPVPMNLKLKIGCEVLFLQNDPSKRWVNGTRGKVTDIQSDKIMVQKHRGREVQVEKAQFTMLDAEGQVVASLIQFPLTLGYATTIHKSQGATLDDLWCDLGSLWEPGQAYVALSRLRSSEGLKILRWHPRSFITDPEVQKFYQQQTT